MRSQLSANGGLVGENVLKSALTWVSTPRFVAATAAKC